MKNIPGDVNRLGGIGVVGAVIFHGDGKMKVGRRRFFIYGQEMIVKIAVAEIPLAVVEVFKIVFHVVKPVEAQLRIYVAPIVEGAVVGCMAKVL